MSCSAQLSQLAIKFTRVGKVRGWEASTGGFQMSEGCQAGGEGRIPVPALKSQVEDGEHPDGHQQ